MYYVQVYSVMSVRDELEKCEYLCSEASLSLLPEYHCRKLIFIINYYYYYCCYRSIPSTRIPLQEQIFNNSIFYEFTYY